MSIMKRTVSAGLVALSVAATLSATAVTAQARDRHHHGDDVLLGAAAGLAGGLIGGAIVSGAQQGPVYVEPEYNYAPPPPPPPVVYRRAYYEPAPPPPRCHMEWVENEWGEAYRARVCY